MCFSFSVSQLCCPYVRSISTQKLQITSTPPEDHRHREPHSNTSRHYTLHIHTPVLLCSVLFCFVSHSVSVRFEISLTRQNMSHKTEHVGHWEELGMWLSVATDRILPKAAETLQHQTQDQLDDNITRLMRQDPSQSYSHKESSLFHSMEAVKFFTPRPRPYFPCLLSCIV